MARTFIDAPYFLGPSFADANHPTAQADIFFRPGIPQRRGGPTPAVRQPPREDKGFVVPDIRKPGPRTHDPEVAPDILVIVTAGRHAPVPVDDACSIQPGASTRLLLLLFLPGPVVVHTVAFVRREPFLELVVIRRIDPDRCKTKHIDPPLGRPPSRLRHLVLVVPHPDDPPLY